MSLTPLDPEAMRAAGLRAMRVAEEKNRKANARVDVIREWARRHLQLVAHSQLPWYRRWRVPPEFMPIDRRLLDVVTDAWASNDPQWKAAVSDNRWYLDQAAAYGANGTNR